MIGGGIGLLDIWFALDRSRHQSHNLSIENLQRTDAALRSTVALVALGLSGARLAGDIGTAMLLIESVRNRPVWDGEPGWESSCWCSISSVLLSSR